MGIKGDFLMNNLKQTGLLLLIVFSVTIGELNAQIRDDELSRSSMCDEFRSRFFEFRGVRS